MIGEVEEACKEFLMAVKDHDPRLLNKQKLHLILHLPECMNQFGATASFNSER